VVVVSLSKIILFFINYFTFQSIKSLKTVSFLTEDETEGAGGGNKKIAINIRVLF